MTYDYTAVIADDEDLTLRALEASLRREFPNIEIVAAVSNGLSLVSAVERYQPDLALLDVQMPRLNGIDAIELLRSRGYRTRYILNTAYSEFEYAKRALDLKVDAYLLKPEKRQNWVAAISKVCTLIDQDRAAELEHHELERLTAEVRELSEREIILSLIADHPAEAVFETYCRLYDLQFAGGAVVTLECAVEETMPPEDEVRRCVAQSLGGEYAFLLNVSAAGACALLLFPDDRCDWTMSRCGMSLVSLLEKLRQAGAVCRAGVSQARRTFPQMARAYRESILALRTSHKQRVVFYTEADAVAETDRQTTNPYILQAMSYIRGNYPQDISLEMVAEHIGISPTYLSHLFRQETGMTLVKYLTSVRIDEALVLMQNTDLTAAQISERVGYQNPTYFCRIFKAVTGRTFTQHRRPD